MRLFNSFVLGHVSYRLREKMSAWIQAHRWMDILKIIIIEYFIFAGQRGKSKRWNRPLPKQDFQIRRIIPVLRFRKKAKVHIYHQCGSYMSSVNGMMQQLRYLNKVFDNSPIKVQKSKQIADAQIPLMQIMYDKFHRVSYILQYIIYLFLLVCL